MWDSVSNASGLYRWDTALREFLVYGSRIVLYKYLVSMKVPKYLVNAKSLFNKK